MTRVRKAVSELSGDCWILGRTMSGEIGNALAIDTGMDQALIFCSRWEDILILNLTYRANGDTALPLDATEVSRLIDLLSATKVQPPGSVEMAPQNRANAPERTVLTITWGARVRLSFVTGDDSPIFVDLNAPQVLRVNELLEETLVNVQPS